MTRIKFSVSGFALLFLTVILFMGAGSLLLLIFIAAAVHELGHCAALKLCGGRLEEIRLELTGFVMSGTGFKSYAGETLTAAAGPLASIALAVLCAYAGRIQGFEAVYKLAGLSLVFCLFNLLPVLPLDGGRILYCVTARFFGLVPARRITCAASCVVILMLLCAGVYVQITTKTNFTLLLAAIWMLAHYVAAPLP